ncbi:MAG: Hsp20/alpha crystallin family protein [Anaerolineales bacterium]|nr:Hsp20/alpha crystallin family protein [Anaerolineales bacterium]
MFQIMRRDPFRELMSIRSMMDRLFDSAFAGWDLETTFDWELPLDVVENDDEYVVKASLPGINPDDLEITYSGNTLTIKGEIKSEEESKKGRYHLRERRYGSFCRSITLPSTVKADGIEASYEAGVLKLHLPKAEEAKPKRIAVKSEATKMIEGKVSDIKSKN